MYSQREGGGGGGGHSALLSHREGGGGGGCPLALASPREGRATALLPLYERACRVAVLLLPLWELYTQGLDKFKGLGFAEKQWPSPPPPPSL